MNDDDGVVAWHYEREVRLFFFAEDDPFGVYDRETHLLLLLDEKKMGDLHLAAVVEELEQSAYGSVILFGVPRKAYEWRQRMEYDPPAEDQRSPQNWFFGTDERGGGGGGERRWYE